MGDILRAIEKAELSVGARRRAQRIFEILASAEAEVHGGSTDEVWLHEVGELDSIMDVVGIAVALDGLGNPSVSCGPLPSGRGKVSTSHGMLECPVPAVQVIARRYAVPLEPAQLEGETVTPTGIAVLAECCGQFAARDVTSAVRRGAGAGTRRFADRPNVVRVYGW